MEKQGFSKPIQRQEGKMIAVPQRVTVVLRTCVGELVRCKKMGSVRGVSVWRGA